MFEFLLNKHSSKIKKFLFCHFSRVQWTFGVKATVLFPLRYDATTLSIMTLTIMALNTVMLNAYVIHDECRN
jgi:hypothetical protein